MGLLELKTGKKNTGTIRFKNASNSYSSEPFTIVRTPLYGPDKKIRGIDLQLLEDPMASGEVMANPSQPKVLTPTIEPKLRKQLQVEARSQVQPKPPAKPNGQVQPKSEVKPNPKVQPKPKQHANLGATPTQQSNPQPELSTTKKTGQNTDLNQPNYRSKLLQTAGREINYVVTGAGILVSRGVSLAFFIGKVAVLLAAFLNLILIGAIVKSDISKLDAWAVISNKNIFASPVFGIITLLFGLWAWLRRRGKKRKVYYQ